MGRVAWSQCFVQSRAGSVWVFGDTGHAFFERAISPRAAACKAASTSSSTAVRHGFCRIECFVEKFCVFIHNTRKIAAPLGAVFHGVIEIPNWVRFQLFCSLKPHTWVQTAHGQGAQSNEFLGQAPAAWSLLHQGWGVADNLGSGVRLRKIDNQATACPAAPLGLCI